MIKQRQWILIVESSSLLAPKFKVERNATFSAYLSAVYQFLLHLQHFNGRYSDFFFYVWLKMLKDVALSPNLWRCVAATMQQWRHLNMGLQPPAAAITLVLHSFWSSPSTTWSPRTFIVEALARLPY